MPRSVRLALAGLLLLLPLLATGCRMTPERIRSIEAENELLRQEIQTVKEKCTYYREIEVRPDKGDEPKE